ncbi:unnamed protein product [Notodromas monacha]|uniref:beta-N-acetylhexosaminidase n=1 Tax=Notodromas monacha TaxID=399045 RepID=A0A7R9BDN2_9CRUS|nr:unnamed protein product [Notodromas monacha]CAG0913464.1 unnamed protein product [Notodromas monacha]
MFSTLRRFNCVVWIFVIAVLGFLTVVYINETKKALSEQNVVDDLPKKGHASHSNARLEEKRSEKNPEVDKPKPGVIEPLRKAEKSDKLTYSPMQGAGGSEQIFREKIVHLDLKGGPPKVAYIKEFFKLIRAFGATGVLIEYEDTFPYSLISSNSSIRYSLKEIREILDSASEHGLQVIPLLQTFGHLEFMLKRREFEDLRENVSIPQAICPLKTRAVMTVKSMIDEVMEVHKHYNVSRLHLGMDEVYLLGTCSKCRERNVHDLFLDHVSTIVDHVEEKYPGVKSLIWDDMLRKMLRESGNSFSVPAKALKKLRKRVEPVVWWYRKLPETLKSQDTFFKMSQYFGSVWAAGAFKGADGSTVLLPKIGNRLQNLVQWLDNGLNQGALLGQGGFEGIVLTGWSRYDHFSVLCELLPAGMPSLILSLAVLNSLNSRRSYRNSLEPKHLQESVVEQITRKLECPQFSVTTKDLFSENAPSVYSAFRACSFPGNQVFLVLNELETFLEGFHAWKKNSRISGWMNEYNFRRNYFHISACPKVCRNQVKDQSNALQRLIDNLKASFKVVFPNFVVEEFVELKLREPVEFLGSLREQFRKADKNVDWPDRPFSPDPSSEMSHSVPVPPPLPVLDIGERKVCSPVPKPLDLRDEAAKIAQKLSEENTSEPNREPFIYFGSKVDIITPVLQQGPTCGLVAAEMASKMLLTSGQLSVEDLLVHCIRKKTTTHGEMFSADWLGSAVADLNPNLSFSVENANDFESIFLHLQAGNPILIPYDTDANHQPALKRGHKAHWAVVFAAVIIPGSSDVVHHKPERTWLLALHGKSCHVQVWQYADFLESNLNLSEISPEKADYCVPDASRKIGGTSIPTMKLSKSFCFLWVSAETDFRRLLGVMEILETTRSRPKIAYKGYLYVMYSDRRKNKKNHIIWKCEKNDCKGRATTPLDYENRIGEDVVEVQQEHYHLADNVDLEVAAVRGEVMKRALNSREPVGELLSAVLSKFSVTQRALAEITASSSGIKKAAQRLRSKHNIKVEVKPSIKKEGGDGKRKSAPRPRRRKKKKSEESSTSSSQPLQATLIKKEEIKLERPTPTLRFTWGKARVERKSLFGM